jgi:hypothetical protein
MAYSVVYGLMRARKFPPASGPCDIQGCRHDSRNWWCGPGHAHEPACRHDIIVYDHCHTHDYIRGSICLSCNGRMIPIDQFIQPYSWQRQMPALIAHWERCPHCVTRHGRWRARFTGTAGTPWPPPGWAPAPSPDNFA